MTDLDDDNRSEALANELNFTVIGRLNSGSKGRQQTPSLQLDGDGDGWLSAPSCPYPQELLISLKYVCLVEALELAINAASVPKKVEVFFGVPRETAFPIAAKSRPDETIFFKFVVGYLWLIRISWMIETITVPNSNCRAISEIFFDEPNGKRQQVYEYIGATALFIRFLFDENYQNDMNEQNRVGISKLKLFGRRAQLKIAKAGTIGSAPVSRRLRRKSAEKEVSSSEEEEKIDNLIGKYKYGRSGSSRPNERNKKKSDCATSESRNEPMPFATKLSEFNTLLRIVKRKQQNAVREERYLDADSLKNILAVLDKKEWEMNQINTARKAAIYSEDYQTAMQLKQKFENIRDNWKQDVPALEKLLTDEERKKFFPDQNQTGSVQSQEQLE